MVIAQTPGDQIWDIEYFKEPWTTIGSVSNSFPVWITILVFGFLLKQKLNIAGTLISIVGLSGLAHVILDFFTHADDAHQHFWPISSWRFESPFSYWDVDHNAAFILPIEGLIVLLSSYLLWKRTSVKFYKVLLALSIIIGFVMLLSPIAILIAR